MEKALEKHYAWRGKFEIALRAELDTPADLALAYTPGVALPCLEIEKDPQKSFALTRRWNTVAVITDGTAVLGLGDIGPEAAMPVMEGKAALFKKFGDVDAIPLCLKTKDVDEIVNTIALLEGNFGGINLEDISAPRCFEIEEKLVKRLQIPVFHDDQHGTAIVTLAACHNYLRLVKKTPDQVRIVVNGAGAAGIAIIHLLQEAGYTDIIACGRDGIIYKDKPNQRPSHQQLAARTNPRHIQGDLATAMAGAHIFIGVSGPNCVSQQMVASMGEKPAVFAMSNPTPEIMPPLAQAGGAYVIGTGRSDFPNQINNASAFPGVFRGVLDKGAKHITTGMKIAAATAIAQYIPDTELTPSYMMPDALNMDVAKAVASAVYHAD